MRHPTLSISLILCLLSLPAPAALAQGKNAPGKQAAALRQAGDLVPYSPSQAVLAALFTADEDAPRGVFGPVSAYAKASSCPTAWLIEKGELARIERRAALGEKQPEAQKDAPPFEFSLTLEEDCKGAVTHSVFVASPGATPEGWLKWRSQFHGRKAEAHYATTLARLKKAGAAGLAPTAELRFVSVNGELVVQNLEDRLRSEGRLRPLFDLETGARAGK